MHVELFFATIKHFVWWRFRFSRHSRSCKAPSLLREVVKLSILRNEFFSFLEDVILSRPCKVLLSLSLTHSRHSSRLTHSISIIYFFSKARNESLHDLTFHLYLKINRTVRRALCIYEFGETSFLRDVCMVLSSVNWKLPFLSDLTFKSSNIFIFRNERHILF